jgi:hypothetical protein
MSLFAVLKSFFGFKENGKVLSPRDRLLTCLDCGTSFVFDEGEQKFFKDKGFTDPKRCPRCRKKVRSRVRRRKGGGSTPRTNGRRRSVIDGDSPYADER